MSAAVLSEARARLAALWPNWTDRSGDPHPPTSATGLPAFAVAIEETGSERAGMGDATRFIDGELAVTLWQKVTDKTQGREEMRALTDAARNALLADPADLGGAAFSLEPATGEVVPIAERARTITADLTFALRYLS